ncbi:Imm7 family immunity protein [Streptomyces sp. NPDC058231]|uniref:Imm7 family immunity protein n=1 Tax=Streptomyces sp. NPDC058231 TaxID=3346392 RepID=UPI0036EA4F2E
MFEHHGWITICESAADDEDNSRLAEIVERLQHRIQQIDSPYLLDLRWMNGEPFLHMGGFSNHRTSPEILDLFHYVGAIAPGSYGLLHLRDDEDPAHGNEVRVLALVRGSVTEHTEPRLSPCIPTLEDPSAPTGRAER